MQCVDPLSSIRAAPAPDAEQRDQLLFGEIFDVLEIVDGWAWGQARRDGIVGHVSIGALSRAILEPTHRVSSIKAAMADSAHQALSLNAFVTVEETREGLVRVARLGWFSASDLADFHAFEAEPATVAERFAGTPHDTGGRAVRGLDAAGLIQQALYACGMGCPRTADQQQNLGADAPADDLRRGDLLFWEDHAALMLDAERLIHAEPDQGVRTETLASIIARRRASPQVCRRL